MADPAIAFSQVGSPGEDPFDLEGDLLDGQIRIEKIVGEGELSVVYRGLHEGMNAPVAIKCLNLPLTLEPQLVEPITEGFREGARLHYRLAQGHLHIAQTLALGTTLAPRTGQSIPYVVREWLDGRSLAADFEARARGKTRPRSPALAVELLDSAADAVAYAHAEGVSHHAVNPYNLFLAKARRGEVLKVLDFGMAAASSLQPGNAGLRLLSSHAAPEQLDRRIGAPSAATDVFAFALVLYEAIAGRPYFMPGAHVTEMLRVAEAREPLTPRPGGVVLPRELEAVLVRALAPKPEERYPNLRAFWDDVKGAVQRREASTAPRSLPPPVHRPKALASIRPATTKEPSPPLPDLASRPDPASRPAPTSVTAEVAPPVTTSAVFPAASDAEDAPALERDTVPTPPTFVEDAFGPTTFEPTAFGPSLSHAAIRPRWRTLLERAQELAHRPPGRVTRVAAVVTAGAASAIVVLVALTVSPAAKHTAAAEPGDRRSPHAVASQATELTLADVRLRPAPKAAAFDRAATTRLFDATAAELESCTHRGSPRGPGSVRVIILPSGKIARIQIGPPYAGTATGECITGQFVATPIPAFVGPPQAVNYIFNTISFSRP
jgi:serine/threonine protein kinase